MAPARWHGSRHGSARRSTPALATTGRRLCLGSGSAKKAVSSERYREDGRQRLWAWPADEGASPPAMGRDGGARGNGGDDDSGRGLMDVCGTAHSKWQGWAPVARRLGHARPEGTTSGGLVPD
jgi:hypothetical protein